MAAPIWEDFLGLSDVGRARSLGYQASGVLDREARMAEMEAQAIDIEDLSSERIAYLEALDGPSLEVGRQAV